MVSIEALKRGQEHKMAIGKTNSTCPKAPSCHPRTLNTISAVPPSRRLQTESCQQCDQQNLGIRREVIAHFSSVCNAEGQLFSMSGHQGADGAVEEEATAADCSATHHHNYL